MPPHVNDTAGTDGNQQRDQAFSCALAEAEGAPAWALRRHPGLSWGGRQGTHVPHFRPAK